MALQAGEILIRCRPIFPLSVNDLSQWAADNLTTEFRPSATELSEMISTKFRRKMPESNAFLYWK